MGLDSSIINSHEKYYFDSINPRIMKNMLDLNNNLI